MDVLGLGIQLCKRAKQLFFGLLDDFSGAAAAYSLRKLSRGYSGPIIRVRRDGDADGATNERDFNSTNQIADWVNGKQETTLPADVATSAAAYSLRKVKAGYTGDAVRIRRESDDVEVNVAFDGNGEVSASSAITNVEDISLVSESGFATDTGGFESSISGANFSFGNTLDGKSNVLFSTFDGSGLLGLNFATSDVAIGDVINYSFDVYWDSSNVGGLPDLRIRSGNTTIGHTDVPMPSKDSWYTFSGQFTVTGNTPAALTLAAVNSSGLTTGDIFAIANGSYAKQQDAGDTTATTLGGFLAEATPARNRIGSARYDTFTPNGVTGFTAITNNIAAGGFDIAGASGTDVQVSFDITLNSGQVSIKLRPDFETGSDVSNEETITTSGSKSFTLTSTADFKAMLFITASADFVVSNFSVNVPYNHDTFVQTWYDQSGNNYHATQDVAGNQPKIAEAGALLADGIDFDGVDDFLTTSQAGSFAQPISLFQVFNSEDAVTSDYQIDAISNTAMLSGSDGSIFYFAGSLLNSTIDFPTSGDTIHSVVYSGSSSTVFADGVLVATGNTGSGAFTKTFSIGARKTGTQASRMSYKELVIYDSDQSTNRFKIESNINNYYGIYTASQNGFVHTWYDQSGNGYDATQTANDDQPTIVNAGSLLADGIDFDGVDDFFTASGVSTTQPYSVFMKIKASETGTVQQIFDSGSVDPAFFQLSTAGVLSINNPTSTVTSLDLTSTPTDVLISGFIDDPKTAFANGASILSPASGTGTNSLSGLTIGKHRNLSSNYYSGNYSELIIYDSDQSANRSGIESNIADEYGITLP